MEKWLIGGTVLAGARESQVLVDVQDKRPRIIRLRLSHRHRTVIALSSGFRAVVARWDDPRLSNRLA